VARLAAGDAFYSTPLPQWASDIQFVFNAAVVAAIVYLGRGGFWNVRGPQPTDGYPVLVAGAVLSAALPLMIPSAGPQYVTVAVPLMTLLLVETWRRRGTEIVTEMMVVWSIAAWLSMIVQEVPWAPPETHWTDDMGPARSGPAKSRAAAQQFDWAEGASAACFVICRARHSNSFWLCQLGEISPPRAARRRVSRPMSKPLRPFPPRVRAARYSRA
jgi:hypothetical protein